MTVMQTKGLKKDRGGQGWLKVKDAAKGEVTCAFAQLEVVDHDNDWTQKGAFQPGQKLKVCQTGHAHGALVAGAGMIIGEQAAPDGSLWAVADVKYFLDTPQGAAEFATIKALEEHGHTQEWSYGYDILDAGPGQIDGKNVQVLKSLSVYEVSPVLRGAGIGTHTLGVKAAADADTCETCGQALAKAATDTDELVSCEDCGKDEDACECADAKGQEAEQVFLQWIALKARLDGVPIH